MSRIGFLRGMSRCWRGFPRRTMSTFHGSGLMARTETLRAEATLRMLRALPPGGLSLQACGHLLERSADLVMSTPGHREALLRQARRFEVDVHGQANQALQAIVKRVDEHRAAGRGFSHFVDFFSKQAPSPEKAALFRRSPHLIRGSHSDYLNGFVEQRQKVTSSSAALREGGDGRVRAVDCGMSVEWIMLRALQEVLGDARFDSLFCVPTSSSWASAMPPRLPLVVGKGGRLCADGPLRFFTRPEALGPAQEPPAGARVWFRGVPWYGLKHFYGIEGGLHAIALPEVDSRGRRLFWSIDFERPLNTSAVRQMLLDAYNAPPSPESHDMGNLFHLPRPSIVRVLANLKEDPKSEAEVHHYLGQLNLPPINSNTDWDSFLASISTRPATLADIPVIELCDSLCPVTIGTLLAQADLPSVDALRAARIIDQLTTLFRRPIIPTADASVQLSATLVSSDSAPLSP